MVYFLRHKLLNSSQHGFLKARLDEARRGIASRYYLHRFSESKVPHQKLLLKLKAHGIGDNIIDWMEQWLTDRRQRVVVDGEVPNWKSVLSGVPQGSVLGPLLFLIYILVTWTIT